MLLIHMENELCSGMPVASTTEHSWWESHEKSRVSPFEIRFYNANVNYIVTMLIYCYELLLIILFVCFRQHLRLNTQVQEPINFLGKYYKTVNAQCNTTSVMDVILCCISWDSPKKLKVGSTCHTN